MVKTKQLHIAEKYAKDVLSGKILSSQYVKKACQRYFDDLKASPKSGFYFDQEDAQRYIDFIEYLPMTKGKDFAGKPLKLSPWQQFIIWNVYGWKKVANDKRRFNNVTICVPKKNGKTELIAAISIAHLVLDDEFGAEIYMAATAREQAKICFKAAQTMVQLTPELYKAPRKSVGILEPLKSAIVYAANNSSIKHISSESGPIEGGGASLVIYDEEHEQTDTELKDNLKTGQAAKPDSLFISISTAGVDKNRPYYTHVKDCLQVLDGLMSEEDHFILIYGVDPDDDWREPKTLEKANPNWGVSVIPDKVIASQQSAIQKPREQVSFKTKHLNIWTDAAKTWIPNEKWIANKRDINIESFYGKNCWAGIDLASSRDFTALALTFEQEDYFYTFWRYWIPEESMEERSRRDNINFRLWEQEGYITITPGNVVDYKYIEKDILELNKKVKFNKISYDPHNSSELVTNLTNEGLPMMGFPQGITYMSQPTKEFEKLVLDQKYLHDGNKVTTWMLSNVVIVSNPNEDIKPSKNKSANKIDGIFAAINAKGGYLNEKFESAKKGKSVYETRGLRELPKL